MPKPTYKISQSLVKSLKWKMEEVLFFKISNKLDCRKIALLVQEKTTKTVSESTLYRLFLWEGNQNSPYLHTLDILAEFIGNKNWFELEKELNELNQFRLLFGVLPSNVQYKSLLSINLHHGSLKPLYSFLEQFQSDISFDKKVMLGEELYLALKTNPSGNATFFKQFHSLPIIREGFFEIFADPNFSINDYESGLLFYLKNVKPQDSIKSLQDFLFANSLLLRYYFFGGDKTKVLEIGRLIYLDLPLTEHDLSNLYIYPRIRYFAYRLFYNSCVSKFDFIYWEWLLDFSIREIENAPSEIERRIVIHTILDSLQINSELQHEIYLKYKILFPDFFSNYPNYVLKLPIQEQLKYFEANAVKFT